MVKNLEVVPPRAQVAVLIDGDHIPPKVSDKLSPKPRLWQSDDPASVRELEWHSQELEGDP